MRALVDSGSTDVDTWTLSFTVFYLLNNVEQLKPIEIDPNLSVNQDLKQSKISSLKLAVDKTVSWRLLGPERRAEELPALFETAGGVTTSAPIYWAIAKVGDSYLSCGHADA